MTDWVYQSANGSDFKNNKKIEVYVVVMGLFSKPKQNIITKYFQGFS